MPASRTERLLGSRRLLLVIYWGAAVALAPWIVLLAVQQAPRGTAYRVHLVGLGVSLATMAGMLATAAWCRRNSHFTVPAGVFTGTLAFISAWFGALSATGARQVFVVIYAVVVLLPITAVCAWTVRRLFRPHGSHAGPPGFVPPFLVAGVVVLVPLLAVALAASPPGPRSVGHLRIVWVGLDVFELLGLAATAWCLQRRIPQVAVAGAFTGTLLLSDAWFNVMASTGRVQLAALVMCLAEVPLALLSFAVARREVEGWPEAMPRPPGGSRPGGDQPASWRST